MILEFAMLSEVIGEDLRGPRVDGFELLGLCGDGGYEGLRLRSGC